jgi:hypothetical protein
MEPLLPDDQKELEDLATDLVAKANGLAAPSATLSGR